jgi:hypothetical protein
MLPGLNPTLIEEKNPLCVAAPIFDDIEKALA